MGVQGGGKQRVARPLCTLTPTTTPHHPDNSYKTLLTEPKATVLDTCKSLAEKLGFSDPEDDALCFSLNECLDGVTSA